MGLWTLQPHQKPLHSSESVKPGPLPSSVPPLSQHVAKQRASVLVWTEVSSLKHFHSRRRGLPTFARGNPLSDEGTEIRMVLLTHRNPHPHPFPTVVRHFALAIAPSASMSKPPAVAIAGGDFPCSPVRHPTVPSHCLLRASTSTGGGGGGCALAMPQPLSHLPDVIQELGGGEALLRAGKLLAVVPEKGQQVRVQVKQPATARGKPPSSH